MAYNLHDSAVHVNRNKNSLNYLLCSTKNKPTKHIWIYKYNNNHQKGSRVDMTFNNL